GAEHRLDDGRRLLRVLVLELEGADGERLLRLRLGKRAAAGNQKSDAEERDAFQIHKSAGSFSSMIITICASFALPVGISTMVAESESYFSMTGRVASGCEIFAICVGTAGATRSRCQTNAPPVRPATSVAATARRRGQATTRCVAFSVERRRTSRITSPTKASTPPGGTSSAPPIARNMMSGSMAMA